MTKYISLLLVEFEIWLAYVAFFPSSTLTAGMQPWIRAGNSPDPSLSPPLEGSGNPQVCSSPQPVLFDHSQTCMCYVLCPGAFFARLFSGLWGSKELRVLILGLDGAGKTTILYRLQVGEVVTTIPSRWSSFSS